MSLITRLKMIYSSEASYVKEKTFFGFQALVDKSQQKISFLGELVPGKILLHKRNQHPPRPVQCVEWMRETDP